MNYQYIDFWLEEENPLVGNLAPGNGAPQAGGNGFNPDDQTQDMTNTNNPGANMMPQGEPQGQEEEDDVTQDPSAPHMPDEKKSVDDFGSWKNAYLKESIRGDTNKLVDMLNMVREKDGLNPYEKKFIEDNYNVQLVRQNANIDKASKDIRRNIKEQLDRNNPATTIVNHMTSVLETIPNLNNTFIKLSGYGTFKGDLHRKYIAALIGGVQVGSGADKEDLVYNEKEYSILISTRCNSEFGEVMIGNWGMHVDDPDHYLSEPEKKRLTDGSPEEKEVLRKRVILESICHQYETRSFIINVAAEDGTIYTLGWDIAGSLKDAYSEGKIVIKPKVSDNAEAMITEGGEIVSFMDLDIFYGKETGEMKDNGLPEIKELPFLEKRHGMLFLVADINTIREASQSMQGMVFKQTPYNGNPSDLRNITRCVYTAHDLLLRTC